MGNSSTAIQDCEIRSLVHDLDSYLKSKSAILYQISQLKLKLNSRTAFSEATNDSEGIVKEIEEIPKLVSTLLEIGDRKAQSTALTMRFNNNFADIFDSKNKEIEELYKLKEDEIKILEELAGLRSEAEAKYNQALSKTSPIEGLNTVEEVKGKCSELIEEIDKLATMAQELKSKEAFLSNKKLEMMTRRGNKRKTFLGIAIVNSNAMDLRSKYILKNEIIKTIQQTKKEQQAHLANIEKKRAEAENEGEPAEDSEENLMQELSQNKHIIYDLEWEIQALHQEREKLKKIKPISTDLSINFGSAEKINSDPSEENSLGSSIASLLNGFGDFKIEKEALAEENLRLKQHITELFSLRQKASPELNNQ